MNNMVLYGVVVFLSLTTDSLQREVGIFISTLNSTGTQRQTNYGCTCTLPDEPENGRWFVINGEGVPGGTISEDTIVQYECNKGYMLTSKSRFLICTKEWKSFIIPECEKLCPPLWSTATTKLTCKDKNGFSIPCDRATEGSYLTVKCALYYEMPPGNKKNLLCLPEGIWNYPKPVCQPVCGKKIGDDEKLQIYGGNITKILEYPWVATLYSNEKTVGYEVICGGSIISHRVVLTAAHCVTNEYGDTLSPDYFQIAAGKLYNKYGDSRDTYAQYLGIYRIIVHGDYRAKLRNYLFDIAIIITRKSFVLSNIIQPICFNNVKDIHLHAREIGVVSGFGLDESGISSEQLRFLEIPYKHPRRCAEELPKGWTDQYYFSDKICAGFFNMSMSVCEGDSGNGLAFRNSEDNRYYIHGIVSLAPPVHTKCDIQMRIHKSCCNVQQNSLYTNVGNYSAFINRVISKYTVEDCVLPAFPKNGKWMVPNQDMVPGDFAPSNTVLKISCNKGFKLSSKTTKVICGSAADMPKCLPLCPALISPKASTINCRNQKGAKVSCSDAPEGTTLNHRCPDGTETKRQCKEGSWGLTLPQCQQVVPVIEAPTNEINTTKVICSYASWQSHKGTNPEDLDADLCDYVNYAFVGLWFDGKLRAQDKPFDVGTSERGLYYRVTDMKKRNPNLKVILSVGGGGASNAFLFSSLAASPAARSGFIEDAKTFLQTYNFDGLDIEWHIPAVEDKDNYINLFKELRKVFQPYGFLLTATVRSDPDGTGYDGSQMNQILDWVNVKTYDMYGEWSQYTGQNSPLYASSMEYDWEKKHLNVDASGKNWLAAGVAKTKLALSIAFYGKSFTLRNNQEHGIHARINGAGPGESGGFLRYSEICEKYSSWTRVWDNEQKNPYKYSGNQWFGYDDADSVLIKAEYIKSNGFFGVNVWPVDGDDVDGKCGEKQILLKKVHGGLGRAKN